MGDEFVCLKAEDIKNGLSEILPIHGGGGFAFSKLDCSSKEPPINHLGNKLKDCTHLQHVVLSSNQISDIEAVSKLPHLLKLQIDKNAITNLDCFTSKDGTGPNLPWCQHVDLSENKLTALPDLTALPRLRFLILETNEIASLEAFGGHPNVEEINLQGNKLTNLVGLGRCERLRFLNVSGNTIASLEGLDAPALETLDASKNALTTLEHVAGAPACTRLDISENQLAPPEEADSLPQEFIRLGDALPKLKSIAMAGNPIGEMKAELLFLVPRISQVDGENVTDEDRQAAAERGEQIAEATEARRKAAEEAAAEAAAAAAAGEEGEAAEE
eukprot:TRINITY_DN27680_c0_g1_i1.p1 TRINITY_DN27680_c0_g1~~TRINITY_DN27680_c0_g1_i1.p1  ORF type:complete len:330 (-),score=87.52 TRINITY_DN27680_c0_g1_i1:407-1396(-)